MAAARIHYSFVAALLFGMVLIITPLASHAQQEPLVPCGTGEPGVPACEPCHFVVLLVRLINFGIKVIALPLALLMFVWAGFTYALSGGSQNKIGKAKTILINTVIGLLIVFGAYFIVDTAIKILAGNNFQNNKFLNAFGPWNAPTIQEQFGDPNSPNCPIQETKPSPGGSLQEATGKVSSLIQTVANAFGSILMGISVLMVLYSSWLYLTSAGSEESVTTAKRVLIFALIGIAVALAAFALPTLIISLFQSSPPSSGQPSLTPSSLPPGVPAAP